ncbi:hypothetical protein SEA_DELAGARZA_40 [Microbacterium phage DelaGarza]|nr:hypothetical protein SEA_DELAGARZA_40 [Microbacterium phage DelaGarza]
MQTIIPNAQARGTLESFVPPSSLAENADELLGHIAVRVDAIAPDVMAAFALLGATREDMLRHLAHEAIEAAFA